ncbi:MAG: hypothetical protein KBC42_03590 [Candidatus Pacebacteria bacterium]|nr:hypothetical protein [Candidatus Paceibacterota bacterium]MBP9780979.1 hypothetical protein [Candidatus Paceibacterota bacterium]
MFKNFLMKQMLKRQLKGVPEAEQERIIKLVTENPELFEKIGKEIQEKTKGGMPQSNATMVVMQKYQAELQKLMGGK